MCGGLDFMNDVWQARGALTAGRSDLGCVNKDLGSVWLQE